MIKTEKRCNNCKEVLETDFFFVKKSVNSNSLSPNCKVCTRALHLEYRNQNPEAFKKRRDLYYKNNSESKMPIIQHIGLQNLRVQCPRCEQKILTSLYIKEFDDE